jgi:hypothetical protein
LDKRKVMLLILTIFIVLINVLAIFRWEYNDSGRGEMRYKTDSWTNKVWVEFYPSLAEGPPIEFALINSNKFDSLAQLEAHVNKYAISGRLVEDWIERMKLTYLYYGINSFLIFIILLLLAMIIRTRMNLKRKSV